RTRYPPRSSCFWKTSGMQRRVTRRCIRRRSVRHSCTNWDITSGWMKPIWKNAAWLDWHVGQKSRRAWCFFGAWSLELGASCRGSQLLQTPLQFFVSSNPATDKMAADFPAVGLSARLDQSKTIMAESLMRAVGVIPGQREVRLMEHQAPKIAEPSTVKIRSLEVCTSGTDREIRTFVSGWAPAGF